MHLIIGLGNPGSKYLMTRHNIGFLSIDAIADRHNGSFKSEHKSETCKIRLNGEQALLVKPQTYMNLSGEAVRALVDYYDIELENILVIHDEVDLAYGAIRFQANRGHGGHNGIRNIHQHLGTKDYARLKLGVSRPSNPNMDVADFVLQNFDKTEQKNLVDFVADSVDAIECFIEENLSIASTRFNRTKLPGR